MNSYTKVGLLRSEAEIVVDNSNCKISGKVLAAQGKLSSPRPEHVLRGIPNAKPLTSIGQNPRCKWTSADSLGGHRNNGRYTGIVCFPMLRSPSRSVKLFFCTRKYATGIWNRENNVTVPTVEKALISTVAIPTVKPFHILPRLGMPPDRRLTKDPR